VFTSVIGALTSLLPKSFIFGAYVPVLIFGFINFGLTYLLSAWFRHVTAMLVTSPLALVVAFVLTVVLAYVTSSVNDFLREFLEGRYARWLGPLKEPFRDNERRRREVFQRAYQRARSARYRLEQRAAVWQDELRNSATKGVAKHPTATTAYNRHSDPAARGLRDLRLRLVRSQGVKPTLVEDVVRKMATALETHNETLDADLANDHRDLVAIGVTVLSAATEAEYDAARNVMTYFGTGTPEPTRMGNIAAAIRSYAVSRYGMDMSTFFTRLQTLLVKKEDKAYPIVLDAKTQLDFLVTCCWFSAATTIIWYLVLVAQGNLTTFLWLAALGPGATVAFYYLAAENYVAYAECVKAALDINRFALLTAIDIPLPGSNREERRLWGALSRSALERFDGIEFGYEPPKT